MKSALPVIVFVLASAMAAMAQDAAAPAANPTELAPESKTVTGVTPNAGDKIVCVQGDAPTGSRLGSRKTCHTAAQWTQIHDSSRQLLDDMEMRRDNADWMKNAR